MAKGPRTAGKLIFRGFHFVSNDEGKNVEVRLRVKRSDKALLFSTEPVESIWIQQGIFYATIAEDCYWLQLSECEEVKEMHEKAILKIMSFLEDDEIPAQNIWMMNGTIKGIRKNERFYYVGYVE